VATVWRNTINNQLLRIEQLLGKNAVYAGTSALPRGRNNTFVAALVRARPSCSISHRLTTAATNSKPGSWATRFRHFVF
jgi:hypothetical protein